VLGERREIGVSSMSGDGNGNLYGTTFLGGTFYGDGVGQGTVYKIVLANGAAVQ
jgi:hypothetical protein